MFKAFEDLTNVSDQKNFIAYIEDTYKHLQILVSSLPSTFSDSVVSNVLIELGFINSIETLEVFTRFIQKKSQIKIDDFFKLLSTIDHTIDFC